MNSHNAESHQQLFYAIICIQKAFKVPIKKFLNTYTEIFFSNIIECVCQNIYNNN